MYHGQRIRITSQQLSEAPFFSVIGEPGRKFLRSLRETSAGPAINRLLAFAEPTGHLYHRAHPLTRIVPNQGTLTILSANLWHDWPRYRQIQSRLASFAELVEKERVDVLLLQEVARTSSFKADQWLADRLGLAFTYVRTNGDETRCGFEEGLAIFSRYPLEDPQICQLNAANWPIIRRQALSVTAKTPYGEIVLCSVHAGYGRRNGGIQLEKMLSWLQGNAHGRTTLLGGDFNAPERLSRVNAVMENWTDVFRSTNPSADGTTYELMGPWGSPILRMRLDYLFLQSSNQKWRVLDARHLQTEDVRHSDHMAVIARLGT